MHLTAEEIKQCLDFAVIAAPHTQQIEYGQKDSKPRSLEEIRQDIFMGKLGEVACKNMLEGYGISAIVDFNDYGPGKWDSEDLSYNNGKGKWNIDVKCTKNNSKWFLVEWNKLQFRTKDKELPHFFILTMVPGKCKQMKVAPREGLEVRIVGYVDLHRLRPGYENTIVMRKGTPIPDTSSQTLLQADNLGIRVEHLASDWESLAVKMRNDRPFDTSFYHAPTETTAEFLSRMLPVEQASEVRNDSCLPAKYSLLLSGSEAEKATLAELERYMQYGIKILLFIKEEKANKLKTLFHKKYGRSCFNVFIPKAGQHLPELRVVDGKFGAKQYEKLAYLGGLDYNTEFGGRDFNWEQYQVEHAPFDDAMIVRASAGTGKTTVMIDRILYLLAVAENLSPKDIGMITFTNAAAGHMMDKIQERMKVFYSDTHQPRFLRWLEELAEMRIQTIDSFFKRIITEEASWLGYSQGFVLRGFAKEKKDILEEVLDETLRNTRSKDYLDHFKLQRSEYIKAAEYFWQQFNSRGYFIEDIEKMDFGEMSKHNDYKIVNDTLKKMIVEAEKRFMLTKQRANAFSLSDIKAEMFRLTHTDCKKLRLTNLRILFVDEFQDTDNSQIASLVWLRKILDCQMFVVGDVKQSIYRFRGAEENAFDEIKTRLQQSGVPVNRIIDMVLRKNYRTCGNVLAELDVDFLRLGAPPEVDLPYDSNASVRACVSGAGSIMRKNVNKWKVESTLRETLKECVSKGRQTAVLCRTNKQAAGVAEICRKENIPCLLRGSGGFYRCEAVNDFVSMLGGLLYPGDVRLLYNFLLTPYSKYVPEEQIIERQCGNEALQLEYLNSVFCKAGLEKWGAMIQNIPVFIFLRKIVIELNPVGRFAQRFRQQKKASGITPEMLDEIQLKVDTYQLNLNKLFQIIYDHFAGDFISLLDVYDFLKLKAQTNFDEDILYPDTESTGKSIVEVMTVHKAKGLEFETVILPYTQDNFVQNEDYYKYRALYTENTSTNRVGWAMSHIGRMISNDNYDSMRDNEYSAARREAARLLYVASTRCCRDLIFFAEKHPQDEDNWAGLMMDWQEVGEF